MGVLGGKREGAGRKKGIPNKTTARAREAIGIFVEGNIDRLQGWLEQISNGIPKLNDAGEPIAGQYLVPPSPLEALRQLSGLMEYHIPKLARVEHTGKDGGPIETKSMSDLELGRRFLFDLELAERNSATQETVQ